MSLTVFAAQHGMNWINLGLLPGHNSSKGSAEDLNRFGGFLGAMAQSNVDEGPEVAPPKSDRATAFQLGLRVAEAARRWPSFLPYPLQSQLVGALREQAIRRGRIDLISLWSGQSGPLLRHRQAKELFQDLVGVTERTLNQQAQGADGRCPPG